MVKPPRIVAALGTTVALGAALALPVSAVAAPGINLSRTPAPPMAIAPTVPTELNFNVTFETVPFGLSFEVTDLAGNSLTRTVLPISGTSFGETRQYTPPAGTQPGRYIARYVFTEVGGLEAEAAVAFDFASALGALTEEVFHDRNGNGVRDAGDEGLVGWLVNLTNPQGNSVSVATGADGTRSHTGVPAGTWQIGTREDPAASGWIPTTGTSASVVVPENGTGAFRMGLVRPGEVCGTVFSDTNRDGAKALTEQGVGGYKLELTGTTGTGGAVAATNQISGPDGAYCFTNLLPGDYSVKIAKPGGFDLTTPQVRVGRSVTSGSSNTGNDFGLAAIAPSVRTLPPRLTVNKTGPARVRRNATFPFTIVVKNVGRGPATEVVLVDPVPDTMTLAGKPSKAELVNGVLTWRLGTINAGKSKTVRMRVRVRPGVQVNTARNVATVSANGLPATQ